MVCSLRPQPKAGEMVDLADCKMEDSSMLERLVASKVSVKNLAEKYHSKKLLGKGSYGVVHRVVGVKDGKKYAVKEIKKPQSGSVGWGRWRSIVTELQVLAGNDHKNLIKLTDVAVHDGVICLVTDHAAGVTLHRYAATRSLSERATAEVASHVLKALIFLHAKGITHGDVKPENIIITHREQLCGACQSGAEDDIYSVKLVDFGSATMSGGLSVSEEGVSGTGMYLAMEVIDGLLERTRHSKKSLATKSDMFSLGVVLFVCLCRAHPFRGHQMDTLYGMREKLSHGVDFPPETPLTPPCESFLHSLLQLHPYTRPSAPEALRHAWVMDRAANPHIPVSSPETPTCRCGAKVYSPPEHRFPKSYSSESLSSLES